ncbi:hypothetical protein BU23DRAFT_601857 [Bimuria novae-zelandiae CBS 107.79]|uniref:DUF7730 domain-containing protein n=1 Tax=Bimuria novae-zelandiae CBS 107.79 TaxID=1447943 RepID=A0A6A5UWC8_9PLEO|nr:hypothetical protein BU23DRAFT_601857 [Bimuria novae-zelandiae CBS 107.79]
MCRQLRKTTKQKTKASLKRHGRVAAKQPIAQTSASVSSSTRKPRNVRKSTERKTQKSVKANKRAIAHRAANDAVKASRMHVPRRITRRNGLVSTESPPHHKISNVNSKNSRLLRFPAEIRNNIFAHALTVPGQVHISWFENLIPTRNYDQPFRDEGSYRLYDMENVWTDHAFLLPRVCRQIYAETAVRMYEINRFNVDYNYKDTMKFVESRIAAQRKVLIKHDYIADQTETTFYRMVYAGD